MQDALLDIAGRTVVVKKQIGEGMHGMRRFLPHVLVLVSSRYMHVRTRGSPLYFRLPIRLVFCGCGSCGSFAAARSGVHVGV